MKRLFLGRRPCGVSLIEELGTTHPGWFMLLALLPIAVGTAIGLAIRF